jgi:hypothetical protein
VLAETEVDAAGVRLDGGDQLWFAGPYAPGLALGHGRSATPHMSRFAVKKHRARQREETNRPVSEHVLDPHQLELFPTPPRDWSRLDGVAPRALTADSAALVDDFRVYMRGRGWSVDAFNGSTRTLRIITEHLGATVPIKERDVKALASLRETLHGARLLNYLRIRGLLEPEAPVDPHLRRARHHASSLQTRAFATAAHCWIDVLLGHGSRPSLPRRPKTIENYVQEIITPVTAWTSGGLTDPRAITTKHIEDFLEPLIGKRALRLHTALRSFFRALKRERMVFRDPARRVSISVARPLPGALPSDRIVGILDRLPDARSRLIVGLVAIHALFPKQLADLLNTDLDRARGLLRVRRAGRMDHLIYLDEFTMRLATAWERERYERWPDSTNPYLIVSRNTAVEDSPSPVTTNMVRKPFRAIGLTPGALRTDRIFDEARHTEDPVRLMRLFGLSNLSATRYVLTAHPEKRIDPISA